MTKAVLLPLGLLCLLADALPAQTNSATSATGMAVNQSVLNQANTILLRHKLEDAKGAAARNDLFGAAALYEDAKTLVDQVGSGIDAETAQTISGLVATRLEIARQYQHDGNFLAANEQVARALRVDPRNAAALDFKKKNDQIMAAMKVRMPDTATLERIPQVFNDRTNAAILVQDGKVLYEMGKYEEAQAKLNQALALNPDDSSATYYLNLVKQAYYARQEYTRTAGVQDRMVEVSKAFSPVVGVNLPVPNPYFSNVVYNGGSQITDVHTSPGREMIYSKLDHLRIDQTPPAMSDGLPLKEVIHWLGEQSKLRDPDKKGINFLFNPNVEAGSSGGGGGGGGGRGGAGGEGLGVPGALNPTTGLPEAAPAAGGGGGGGGAPETADATTINVQLTLNDISFHDLLNAVVLVADHPIKYSVEDYGVIFSGKPSGEGAEPPVLEMRIFKVDPNTFYDGLLGVSMVAFPTINSSSSSSSGGGFGGSGGFGGGGSGGFGGGGGGFGGGGFGGGGGNGGGGYGGGGGGSSGAQYPSVSIVGGGGGGGGRGGGAAGGAAGGGRGGGAAGGGRGGGGGAATGSGVGPLNYLNSTAADIVAIDTAVVTFFNAIGVNLAATGRSVAFNDKLGLLFVKATPGELDTIERVIQVLNQVAGEVDVKARFIEVEQDDNASLGFDWYLGNFINGAVVANGGSSPSLTVPVSAANPLGAFPGNTASSLVPSSANDQLLTSGLRDAGVPALATITGIMTDPNFRVVLHALQQRNGFENLAEPEAVVISGRQTEMKATQIQSIVTDYNYGSSGSGFGGGGLGSSSSATIVNTAAATTIVQPATTPMEIGPTLDVVPYILSDGYTINMTLIPVLMQFNGYDTPNLPPLTGIANVQVIPAVLPDFTVRTVVTTVNVWDNQTIMLGGLISSSVQTTKDKVPFLGDIPFFGRLFQSQQKNTQKKNLMIFVTAKIVDPAGNPVHSPDEMPFNPATIPMQPTVEGQTFLTNSAAGAVPPPK